MRHLGNIYEGLLEYQPQIAAQDLVIVSKNKTEAVAPKSSLNQEVAYPEGAVYLLTDKGERKATGSYYTPDYIVATSSKTRSRRSVRAKALMRF